MPAYLLDLLDLLVGYGYRPLRAIGWALSLLIASSSYFSTVRPERINTEDHSVFHPVLYAADHLIPVIRFGQTEVWQYHGTAAVLTAALTVLGWTLGTAIAAAASRTLTRNRHRSQEGASDLCRRGSARRAVISGSFVFRFRWSGADPRHRRDPQRTATRHRVPFGHPSLPVKPRTCTR
ncbi:hypothetical protein RKE30_26160 [Streptomyces sp. Li-HN-5-11]|uniref:hypothetical protein n=1 Tax=Streptomyces sp. Li-HN-5-11 TaxID=3075432 RepID=UPI0028B0BAAB|nr:hypothetical protein [Streptomyces sp. Li-HN-5-11]WNM33622.1 hypothetical protein RKE30_26160 [Streptomyces sp. Li-HN-5-11]